MPPADPKTTNWKARLAQVAAADGAEWDRLSDAFDTDWQAAYCAEFRRYAAERKWSQQNIESGWLDNGMPKDAMESYAPGDPVTCARADVVECEAEAANV